MGREPGDIKLNGSPQREPGTRSAFPIVAFLHKSIAPKWHG
jgi:hypothetical protein